VVHVAKVTLAEGKSNVGQVPNLVVNLALNAMFADRQTYFCHVCRADETFDAI
jgi:hypothetical protein